MLNPSRPRVSAAWIAPDKLAITLPSSRALEVKNEQYSARMFPGSEAAGLVRQVTNKSARILTPVYFFRVPLPEDLATGRIEVVSSADDATNRAVFRVDPSHEFLYVLCYPKKESPKEKFIFQCATQRPLSGARAFGGNRGDGALPRRQAAQAVPDD